MSIRAIEFLWRSFHSLAAAVFAVVCWACLLPAAADAAGLPPLTPGSALDYSTSTFIVPDQTDGIPPTHFFHPDLKLRLQSSPARPEPGRAGSDVPLLAFAHDAEHLSCGPICSLAVGTRAPEPSTMGLIGLSLVALSWARRRR